MFDEDKNTITFKIEDTCPFNVVDGQHRVEGLIEAAKQNSEIEEFEVIANIAVNLDEISQMCHFLIVNTTQKSVDKAVEQQIIARLSKMIDVEDVPTLPKWIQRQVSKGEDMEALMITTYLNSEPDSPWYQRIKMANDSQESGNTINQKSFVQSIKSFILSADNPLASITDYDKRNKILKNYWKAIESLLVEEGGNSVIHKTNGIELFNRISSTVFNILIVDNNFTVNRIKQLITHGFQNLPNQFLDVQSSEWWQSGGPASNMNKSGIREVATALSKAMNVKTLSDDIQL